jgi:cold shock protein
MSWFSMAIVFFAFSWLTEKSFGFIRRESGGPDVFIHVRGLTDGIVSLEEGQTVEFDLITNEKGVMAQNLTISKKE